MMGSFLVVQWLRLHVPSVAGPGSIPGQGPRSHMPQGRLNIQCAPAKTWHSQINKLNKYLNYDGINGNKIVRIEGMHILVFGVYHSMFLNQVVILCLENKIFKTSP